INMSGVLKIRTTKPFGESAVSKILGLVENAGAKKAKTEQFISKFARYYTPAVCFAALALAVLPPVISIVIGAPARWGDWIYRALTFLVISCPCALVISIPLTFFAGIGGASREGILVKGASFLEELSRVKYLVFDKTGTLTKGVFEVVKTEPLGIDSTELLRLAAYAEAYSSHPVSLSIKKAYGSEIDFSAVTDVNEQGGSGVTANVNGKTVAAGNAKLMNSLGVEFNPCTDTGTVVYVAENGVYRGYILISDVIKESSQQAISLLKNAGVKKTVMLTGDAETVASFTAETLGIDEYHSELLPGDKVKITEKLLAEKGEKEVLAFTGDGINDAPVLSRADVGIAMGGIGSDAAIEAADVVLMDDNPLKIPKAISLSKRCMKIVYENIYFAIGIKLLCLLLGALGIANMWLAIFADVGVMVIAVLNAIRALKTH
ncbi:MAG: cadmium-translocating P-type ATPase, partial [Eubacterium sp.]|nr:cadmium-translocating P-type ATPase [Eubacterium sp.]